MVNLVQAVKAIGSLSSTALVTQGADDVVVGQSGLTDQQYQNIKAFADTLPRGNTSVYLSTTDNYVGITDNFLRRAAQHKTRSIRVFASRLSRNAARIVEQTVMDTVRYTNGIAMANIINSIGVANPLYNIYLSLTIF